MSRATMLSEGFANEAQQFRDNQLFGTPDYVVSCELAAASSRLLVGTRSYTEARLRQASW